MFVMKKNNYGNKNHFDCCEQNRIFKISEQFKLWKLYFFFTKQFICNSYLLALVVKTTFANIFNLL